jgi:hypothetical protein
MRYRRVVLFGVLAVVIAVASVPMAGQAQRAADSSEAWTLARTAWGDPDLQGIWRNLLRLPLERPLELGEQEFYTDAEVAAMIQARVDARDQRNTAIFADPEELAGSGERNFPLFSALPSYAEVFISPRTSAIIDPPNGRLPPWTPQQIQRWEAREAATVGRGEADTWDDRAPQERCIKIASAAAVPYLLGHDDGGVSINPMAYNPVRQVLQIPGYVAMVMEGGGNYGEYRIIPLDGRPGLGPKRRLWMGDVRGHWEENTLVVVTTNVNDEQTTNPGFLPARREGGNYPGTGETLRITERYTRLGADTLEYRATIEDPDTYTRPYTLVRELIREDDDYQVMPGQCQEANEGFMLGMLAGARADEQAALDGAAFTARVRQQRFAERKAEWAEFNKLYPR